MRTMITSRRPAAAAITADKFAKAADDEVVRDDTFLDGEGEGEKLRKRESKCSEPSFA